MRTDDETRALIERLAIEQAVYNAIGADVKTNTPGNLRDAVNEHFLRLYDETGATGFEVRVNGCKVGTYGFAKVKGRAARDELVVRVVDMAALRACEDDDWRDWCGRWIDNHLVEIAEAYVRETGDTLPGMDAEVVTTPATPDGIRRGGTLRVKPEKVADALGPRLQGTLAGLLQGGEE